MNILGCTFLGADYSYSPTLTSIGNIRKMTISNGDFDTVSVTTNTEVEKVFDIDTQWNNDTVLLATFDTNLNAGNVEFALNNTSDVIIKRREKGSYDWVTIYSKKINKIDDFKILFLDYFYKNNTTYEYACAGLLNGVQSNYNIKEIEAKFYGQFICDKDHIYGTPLDVGSCDTSRVHYITKKESLCHKYPHSYSNSETNYETGTVSGYFVKFDTVNCDFLTENSLEYRKELSVFLSNNKPKILRHEDGRIWLINIDGEVTDTMDGHYLHRITEFNWYESGEYNSEKDLYDSGLSDVSKDFWSNA